MDLIYTNRNKEDEGALKDYVFDLAFGADENDFECKIDMKRHCCEEGFFLYIENTEYGGIIDDIEVDTNSSGVVYHGRTWHGFLGSKCIVPLLPGETSTEDIELKLTDASGASNVNKYLIVSGDANKIIGWLVDRLELEDMFTIPDELSGIMIKNFQFDRYIMAYEGIVKMLKSAGAKLKLNYREGKVILYAEPIKDYSQDEQFDSDLIDMKVKKYYHPLNHLICLGKGDLDERQVLHLYADKQGRIGRIQSLWGIDEVVGIYDYSSAESIEDLEAKGIEKMKEAWKQDSVSTDFNSDSNSYDVGDIVGAKEHITGVEGTAEIVKKIVTINNNITTISYKVGEK